MRRRVLTVAVAAFALVATVFCLVSGNTRAQIADESIQTSGWWRMDFPLRASGGWSSDTSGGGNWSATVATDGRRLTGSMSFTGGPADLQGGSVTGELSGRSIRFGVVSAGKQSVTFSGTVDDTIVSGTYDTAFGDHGTWDGAWTGDALGIDPSRWGSTSEQLAQPAPSVGHISPPFSGGRLFRKNRTQLGQQARASWPRASGYWWPFLRLTAAYGQTVGTNVRVHPSNTTNQVEPGVAINWPADPNVVAAGLIDLSAAHLPYYASLTGGATSPWPISGPVPGLTNYDFSSDPVLEFNPVGRLFYAGVAHDASDPNDPTHCTCVNSDCCCDNMIFLARSPDGGQNWFATTQVVTQSKTSHVETDKPWMTTDRYPGSPGYNSTYVSWSSFSGTAGDCTISKIRMATSTDGGLTFPTSSMCRTTPTPLAMA